jgi:hypothetical protein
MKLSFALLGLAIAPSAAFTVPKVGNAGGVTKSSLFSTAEPPQREAPDAGWVPEWENREGLSPEVFMQSDMSKPDLSAMWECPLTQWDPEE